jgi:hypothetical protein
VAARAFAEVERSRGDGSRFVYRGPQGEELIASGAILEGAGQAAEAQSAHDKLLNNALESVAKAANHPELSTVKPLREDEGAVATPLRCWTIHSQTKAGDVLFSQAVVSNGMGVLLLTFEGPNVPEALARYRRLLKTIRSAQVN